MNNRRLLIAAVFHFVHPVEKDIKKHHKLTQNSVSFSGQSRQVSRCCINFPHELTCQILTNQSIKIRRRAWPWPTRDHKKRSSQPVFLNNWLNFRVRGKFEIKILQWNRLFVCAPLCNIVTQCWYFDWQFAPSKLWFKFQFAAWANGFHIGILWVDCDGKQHYLCFKEGKSNFPLVGLSK